jgi:hypothetical protein
MEKGGKEQHSGETERVCVREVERRRGREVASAIKPTVRKRMNM